VILRGIWDNIGSLSEVYSDDSRTRVQSSIEQIIENALNSDSATGARGLSTLAPWSKDNVNLRGYGEYCRPVSDAAAGSDEVAGEDFRRKSWTRSAGAAAGIVNVSFFQNESHPISSNFLVPFTSPPTIAGTSATATRTCFMESRSRIVTVCVSFVS